MSAPVLDELNVAEGEPEPLVLIGDSVSVVLWCLDCGRSVERWPHGAIVPLSFAEAVADEHTCGGARG